jgi:hypothetical protein
MEVAVVGNVEGMRSPIKKRKSRTMHISMRERGRENSVLIGVKRENLCH